MEVGGISPEIIRKIEVDTVGFAAAEVCRTALEFAGGRKWLQFDEPDVKAKSRTAALKIVGNCMIRRHQEGISCLLLEIQALTTSNFH